MHTHEPHLVIPSHLQSSLLPFLFPSLLGCTDWLTDNMDTPRERERGKKERERDGWAFQHVSVCVVKPCWKERYLRTCMYVPPKAGSLSWWCHMLGGTRAHSVFPSPDVFVFFFFLFKHHLSTKLIHQQQQQQQQQAASSDLKGTRPPCKNAHESGKGKV